MLLCDVHYFLAVPEHRNFTCAAEALHVSQGAPARYGVACPDVQ
ncbi:LysR family transcriptional regulator [Burkholderia ambifaria]